MISTILALPEAVAFDLMSMDYKGQRLRVCLLHPLQSSHFMQVTPVEMSAVSLLRSDVNDVSEEHSLGLVL